MIKNFTKFINESKSSVSIDDEISRIIRNTPEISNLVSNRKIEIKDNKIFFDENDTQTIDLLKTHLGVEIPI